MSAKLTALGFALMTFHLACLATDDAPARDTSGQDKSTRKVGEIIVISHPIFDESAPDAFFIHRWANFLHINTRESTIKTLLSFKEQDEVTENDLLEAQRLLRAEPYLRDAEIHFTERDGQSDQTLEHRDVVVETWDNWSLLPTVDFSRSGGNTNFSFGIKEDNMLGTGIRTRLKYQSDRDRNGYKAAFSMPLSLVPHGNLAADFFDNSDGQSSQLYFERPFFTLDGDRMYSAHLLKEDRVDTLRQNDMDVNEFEHHIEYVNLRYGWLSHKDNGHLSRWLLGATKDQHGFTATGLYPIAAVPKDRDFLYPWLGWQYIQDDFQVLQNVHFINYNEDINLGWQHYFALGLELEDRTGNQPGFHLGMTSSRGIAFDNSLLLTSVNGRGTFNTTQQDNFQIEGVAEYFYQLNPKWTAYGKAVLGTSSNTYLDTPLTLGDVTGLRGYPDNYQHGDHHWLLTAELRNYPNINLYQLAELGWAAFADVGQAFGGPAARLNEVEGPIGAVGIGARIYSSRSSYGNVAHIDLTVPFDGGKHVDSWEWRFLVKNHF